MKSARQIPQIRAMHRRPVVQLQLAPPCARTHAFARAVAAAAAARGLHVLVGARAPHADFCAVVAERHAADGTLPAPGGADVPVEACISEWLRAWARAVREHAAEADAFLVASNPNVVTAAHVDCLLQACLPERTVPIRLAYASLARLVNMTQDWVDTSALFAGRASAGADGEQHGSKGEEGWCDARDQAGGEESVVDDITVLETSEDFLRLMRRSLRFGLQEMQQAADKSGQILIRRSSPRSQLSAHWLRQSRNVPARILRAQLLARRIHIRLVNAFAAIASKSPPANALPSDAHRQRLLREVNDLLPRIEELASRLARRPKTRRRRRTFYPLDPWAMYMTTLNPATSSVPDGVAGAAGRAQDIGVAGGWRCTGCGSMNERVQSECAACEAPSSHLEPGLLPDATEAMNSRLRDSFAASAAEPRPWICGPSLGPLPYVQAPAHLPAVNGHSFAPPSFDKTLHSIPSPPSAPPQTHVPSQTGLQPTQLPSLRRQLTFDLNNAMQACSFDETPNASSGVPGTRNGDSVDANGASGYPRFTSGNGIAAMSHSLSSSTTHVAASPTATGDTGSKQAQLSTGKGINDDRRGVSNSTGGNNSVFSYGHGGGASSSPIVPSTSTYSASPPSSLKPIPRLSESPNSYTSPLGILMPSGGVDGGLNSRDPELIRDIPSASPDSLSGSLFHTFPTLSPSSAQSHGQSSMNSAQSRGKSHMEELAMGSVEANERSSWYNGMESRAASRPIAVPGSEGDGNSISDGNERSSLEVLAAASDAANGGTGTPTQESMRAVSAFLSAKSEARSVDSNAHSQNGMYNMF